MGRERKKPTYNKTKSINEQIEGVVLYYGTAYDDRLPTDKAHVSIRDVADHFDITILKARKMLISAGMYSTDISRQVQELSESGKRINEIMEITGLSRASVHSYLPYTKVIYNMPELSVDAERKKLQRKRESACKEFVDRLPYMTSLEKEKMLWDVIVLHAGCIFYTISGKRFRYKIKENEMILDCSNNILTKDVVIKSFHKVMNMECKVSGPKQLGGNGASYIFSVFSRIGVIKE